MPNEKRQRAKFILCLKRDVAVKSWLPAGRSLIYSCSCLRPRPLAACPLLQQQTTPIMQWASCAGAVITNAPANGEETGKELIRDYWRQSHKVIMENNGMTISSFILWHFYHRSPNMKPWTYHFLSSHSSNPFCSCCRLHCHCFSRKTHK